MYAQAKRSVKADWASLYSCRGALSMSVWTMSKKNLGSSALS
jgi:hypothetical protein